MCPYGFVAYYKLKKGEEKLIMDMVNQEKMNLPAAELRGIYYSLKQTN